MKQELDDMQRQALHSLSVALRYPDETFEADLSTVDTAGLPGLLLFAQEAARLRTASLQEQYLQTFESDPYKSLYLTWHRYGDDPGRGRALAALTELYADAGFEPVGGELPDYVPAVLEFLAEAPDWANAVLLDGLGQELTCLAGRIAEDSSVYAPLMADLARIIEPHVSHRNAGACPVRH